MGLPTSTAMKVRSRFIAVDSSATSPSLKRRFRRFSRSKRLQFAKSLHSIRESAKICSICVSSQRLSSTPTIAFDFIHNRGRGPVVFVQSFKARPDRLRFGGLLLVAECAGLGEGGAGRLPAIVIEQRGAVLLFQFMP